MPIILTDATKLVVEGNKQQANTGNQDQPGLSTLHPHGRGTVLLVNGKERKIGKKSQYLLDMLTLED